VLRQTYLRAIRLQIPVFFDNKSQYACCSGNKDRGIRLKESIIKSVRLPCLHLSKTAARRRFSAAGGGYAFDKEMTSHLRVGNKEEATRQKSKSAGKGWI